MPFEKPKTRLRFEEWSPRFHIWCGFWSNNLCQVLIHSGPIQGRPIRQNESAGGRVQDMEKPLPAETRVCGLGREAARNADLRAARCHCIGECPNAASRTRCSKKSFQRSMSAT